MDINEVLFIGNNKYGQAGIGEKYHNKIFTQPKSFAFQVFIKQISCGAHHSALLTIDGFVYTMGSNIHGALGTSPTVNYSFTPNLVEGISEVTEIQCGPFHMCAVQKGVLYTWGKGIDGQLGHGNTKNIPRPTPVEGLSGQVESVSCGTNHTIITVNHQGHRQCYSFGNGIYGQLGTGQSRNSYIPVKVKLDKIEHFAAGQNHSLFVIGGDIYACGDNSNGQLGTLFNRKFTSQPTKVSFDGQASDFVMVQAKKYSLALTEKGDMYVWGLKAGFGAPKKIRSHKAPKVEVVDARIGSDKVYGLASDGSLYEWDIFKGTEEQGEWVCNIEKVLPNTRPILGFSAGDNYLLVLGDIVKQIESRQTVSHQLSIIEDVDSFSTSLRLEHICSAGTNFAADSHISQDQSNKDYNFQKLKPQSHTPIRKNVEQSPFAPKQVEQYDNPLKERKDFNNLMHFKHESDLNEKPKKYIHKAMEEPEAPIDNLERQYISHDTLDFIKSQSSVIQCQPSNFLKESEKRQKLQRNCPGITDSFLSEEYHREAVPAQMQSEYSEIKQHFHAANFDKKRKHKKIDRLMQLLEKSHHISDKAATESSLKEDESDYSRLKESEVIKSNRLLRNQLREKQVKIGQLQQLLSRKEMQIEAQRQVIKILREKNNSNYASVQQH